MTDNELRKLAHYIVAEVRGDRELLSQVIDLASATQGKKLVNTKTAADMLGISVRQLRSIKEHFTYIKNGNSKQSGVLFDASTLFREYDRYVEWNRQPKTTPFQIIRNIG